MTNQYPIPVVVNGAAGKMGREVIKAVASASDMTLLGAIDHNPELLDKDAGEIAGCGTLEVPITNQFEPMLAMAAQERQLGVMVDFTHPSTVYDSVRSAIAYGVRPVVGTTGMSTQQIQDLAEFAEKASTGCLIIPNFSIGMVLLQQAAVQASKYFDHVEIIELHHNQKADAPSGTAILTARLMAEARASQEPKQFGTQNAPEREEWPAARGAIDANSGLRVHSVRLPGLLAHQEVLFGDAGQVLTLRHDSTNRSCFMPGIILAIKTIVKQPPGLIIGLEHLMELN